MFDFLMQILPNKQLKVLKLINLNGIPIVSFEVFSATTISINCILSTGEK